MLFEQLGISNVRDLEDLIIETIYVVGGWAALSSREVTAGHRQPPQSARACHAGAACCCCQGLISGRLDQREGVLRVKGTVGRDVKLDDVQGMTRSYELRSTSLLRS